MLGKRISLAELVEAAYKRFLEEGLWEDLVEHWCPDPPGIERAYQRRVLVIEETIDATAAEVVRLSFAGQHAWALKVARLYLHYSENQSRVRVGSEVPGWEAFQEVVALVDRIDSFLGVLERGGPGGALARDCRQDLDLLCVLGDWCQDAQQMHNAAEARHLHALVCSYHCG